jgi:hypothetical protein
MKPWEEMFLKLWSWATFGRRKMFTVPLFLVLFLLPASFGLWNSYGKAIAQIKLLLPQAPVELSGDEHDILDNDEWGLIVASAQSEADAARKRDEFKSIYSLSGHKNANGELIWINDILVVRDPRLSGRWLVCIDMYPGPASREQLQTGVLDMLAAERQTGVRGDPVQRWLNGSAPYKFTKAEFERTYGKIAKCLSQ